MTTLRPTTRVDDGFRLLHVDFPGRCHPEHGDLPYWAEPADPPTDRADRGVER